MFQLRVNSQTMTTNGSDHLQPTPFQQLSSLLETQPEAFASGNGEIQDAALRATEHVFNLGAQAFLYSLPQILTCPM